jgi:hypothetical protein
VEPPPNTRKRNLNSLDAAAADHKKQGVGRKIMNHLMPSRHLQPVIPAPAVAGDTDGDGVGDVDDDASIEVLGTANKSEKKLQRMKRRDFLRWIASHPRYETLTGATIFLNAILMIWETDERAVEVDEGVLAGRATKFRVMSFICCLFFLLDLLIRIAAFRSEFLFTTWREVQWNAFDTICVLGYVAEIITDITTVDAASKEATKHSALLRTVRLIRVVRVFHVLRVVAVFRDLRVMVSALCTCLLPLLWFLMVLTLILFGFGIVLTDAVTDYRMEQLRHDMMSQEAKRVDGEMSIYYGGLFCTMCTLFQSITGGLDWTKPMWAISGSLSSFFVFIFYSFIAFTLFALMNVGNALFVDAVIMRSKHDREFVIESTVAERENFLDLLDAAFDDIDENRSGKISVAELQWNIENDTEVSALLSALNVPIHDMANLFELMDGDGDRFIDKDEFRGGCDNLRGDARQLDLAILRQEVKLINRRIRGLAEALASNTGGGHVAAGEASPSPSKEPLERRTSPFGPPETVSARQQHVAPDVQCDQTDASKVVDAY